MFSLFKGGIKNTTNNEIITIQKLVKLIQTPNIIIDQIRNLNINNISEEDYKNKKNKLKRNLDNYTPNGTFKIRNDKNLIQYSQYFYFDIDFNPYDINITK